MKRPQDTVWCAELGVEVPNHHQQQPTQTLIVLSLKTHFLPPILDCEESKEWNWVSDQTWPGSTGRSQVWSSEIRRESGARACPAFAPSRLSDALLGTVTKIYVKRNATNNFLKPVNSSVLKFFQMVCGMNRKPVSDCLWHFDLFITVLQGYLIHLSLIAESHDGRELDCFFNFANFPKYSFP